MSTVTRLVAWLGGAAFVASLAICAWWYFVTLADAGTGHGVPALVFDAALLTIFASHHSFFARETMRRRLSAIPAHLFRTFYVWVASALLVVTVVLWKPIGGDWYDVTGASAGVHVVVQVLGLWLIYRSVAGLDPLELAGIRAATGRERRREPLQSEGPYRWVRHPLYLGWMLLLFGIPHMTADRFAFAALTSVYLIVAIPFEERSLVQSFGNDYVRYRTRVRWRIVPFIY